MKRYCDIESGTNNTRVGGYTDTTWTPSRGLKQGLVVHEDTADIHSRGRPGCKAAIGVETTRTLRTWARADRCTTRDFARGTRVPLVWPMQPSVHGGNAIIPARTWEAGLTLAVLEAAAGVVFL